MFRVFIATFFALLCFLSASNLSKPKVTEISYKIYSMVFSAKYYNPSEHKTFFFVVPFTFKTEMLIE
jgi:hypothetical protein